MSTNAVNSRKDTQADLLTSEVATSPGFMHLDRSLLGKVAVGTGISPSARLLKVELDKASDEHKIEVVAIDT